MNEIKIELTKIVILRYHVAQIKIKYYFMGSYDNTL